MGIDITLFSGEAVDTSNVGWAFTIEFARRCGWMPCGTTAPPDYDEPEPWDGSYDPALGQLVTDDDARALGEAIARGLLSNERDQLLQDSAQALTAELLNAGYQGKPVQVTDKTVKWLKEFSNLLAAGQGFRLG